MRWICSTIGLALLLSSGPALAAPAAPKVDIVHLGLFERYCIGRLAPQPGVVAEVGRRLLEFRAAWDAEGPALLAGAARIAGHPFRFHETVATLHGCTGVASMSAPLTIGAAPYTKAAGGRAPIFEPREPRRDGQPREVEQPSDSLPKLPPLPIRHFVYSLWHEVMHRYVADTIAALPGGTTPLMRKYAGVNPVVRNHIHMFAVETLLWRQLGRDAETQERIAEKRMLGARPYIRAYEIVALEGPEALVAELRPAGR